MQYKLTKQDYIELYPLLSPRQIIDRYKNRCQSERWIQGLYKQANLPPYREAHTALIQRAYAIADNMNEKEFTEAFVSVIAETTLERCRVIDNRIKRFEELYQ